MSSLLESLINTVPEKDKLSVIESRSQHVLASSINFIKFLKENFTNEESEELIKRFINSIRTEDPKKFQRGLTHLKEAKQD